MIDLQRIAIVDDEPDIREMLEEYLSGQGFEVCTAESGAALRALLEHATLDLVLLDVAMPGEDGLSVARYLREHHDVGIVMLTAASEIIDRVVGLEVGADDYITKPFDPREVLARVKSVLRRTARPTEAEPQAMTPAEPSQRMPFGKCTLDLDSHQLFDANAVEVAITSMEFDLLKAFATHPNRVLSRDKLLDLAHNRDWEPFDRSIDIRITRLRKKVEADPSKPQTIKTVRGAGYIFVQN
jgi:two-component system phosphate regulon response regulator OmpR